MTDLYNTHKWIGTVLFMMAGVLVSSNIEISKYAFYIFLSGHILYMYVFWKMNDKPMFTNNLMFACVDLWGIYRWWL